MKKYLSVVALLLAIVMIALCCAACGDDDKSSDSGNKGFGDFTLPFNGNGDNEATIAPTEAPTDPPVAATIVGSWKTTVDFTNVMDNLMEQQGAGLTEEQKDLYRKLYEGISMSFLFQFNADDTCRLALEDSAADSIIGQLKINIKKYIGEILAMSGLTESDLAQYGYTADSYAELVASQIDTSAMNFEPKQGTYRLDGNKLYIVESGKSFDESDYATIELTASTLTIISTSKAMQDGTSQIFADAMLPMVFYRA